MHRVLLLIPTYNERTNAPVVADAALRAQPGLEILFIDDASPDGTGEVLEALAAREPRLRVLHRSAKLGLGSAYLEGFRRSLSEGYDFTLCMDADLSHDPADLPRLISTLAEVDLVCGSRCLPGGGIVNWPRHRRWLSLGAAAYTRLLTGMPLSDPTGGFNGYRNAMLAQLPLAQVSSRGYSFQIEMKHLAWQRGFRVREIPIVFTERREGKSKMSAGIVREALWMVWKLVLKREKPPR